jgi:hypothetical protein
VHSASARFITLQWWVDHYAVKVNERFGVESPIGNMMGLLVKSGHSVREEEGVRFAQQCFYLQSGW